MGADNYQSVWANNACRLPLYSYYYDKKNYLFASDHASFFNVWAIT
jgi:hypothetical protein